jgi:hypothetical protein
LRCAQNDNLVIPSLRAGKHIPNNWRIPATRAQGIALVVNGRLGPAKVSE